MTESNVLFNPPLNLKRLAGRPILIKLGGASLQSLNERSWIYPELAKLRQAGVPIVLVHGGGPMINAELKSRGISWEFVDGQRVTTPQMMEVIEQVLHGNVNRQIVRTLNLSGVPAVGVSGVENGTLRCKSAGVQWGRVGVVDQVDTHVIEAILNLQTKDGFGGVPVVSPIGVGYQGELLNINADWAASYLAQFLGVKKVLFLTDQEGILDSQGKLISEIDASGLEALIESGTVTGGMLTKTRTILSAIKNGVGAVHILNGNRSHALLDEIFSDGGTGTICRLNPSVRPEVIKISDVRENHDTRQ